MLLLTDARPNECHNSLVFPLNRSRSLLFADSVVSAMS